ELREHRARQAKHLRSELDTDLADRLEEIDAEERRARGQLDEATGQALLFGERQSSSYSGATRRAAAESQAARRREELEAYERVEEPAQPVPLGALFLVPDEAAR